MKIEKAIRIIEEMEQMQCSCELCEIRKPALEMAIKALKRQMPPQQEDAEEQACNGCKHEGLYEKQAAYGFDCPCYYCKRRKRETDNYEPYNQRGATEC